MDNLENKRWFRILRIIDLVVLIVAFILLFDYIDDEIFNGASETFGGIIAISMIDLLIASIIVFIVHKIALNTIWGNKEK